MANDNRGTSSLFRRAEQLKRWQESETNKQDIINLKTPKKVKVKFSDGCIFLAAAAAGDKEELKRLLDRGADVNTVNQDGITALHAACIDNNLEIVEFLVDNEADINQCDMEGWTPLHATASCGSLSIAEFLISRGADLSLVNNDGELAIDVADDDDMAQLLEEEMDKRGIDCDASRKREERSMLQDARTWLVTGKCLDVPHSKTGATALHVAAAKGYIKVMRLLLDLGVDVNAKDYDGWTPLHAAAHWSQTEAVEVLCEALADMEAVNIVGQSAYDLADETIKILMDELGRKQASMLLINQARNNARKRKSSPPIKEKSSKKETTTISATTTTSTTITSTTTSTLSSKRESSENELNIAEHGDNINTNELSKVVDGDVASSIDQSEVQSWRRPSLRNKIQSDDKVVSSGEAGGNSNKAAEAAFTEVISNHTDEEGVVLRRNLISDKERNCQDIVRSSDSELVMNSSNNNNNNNSSSRMTNSLLHSSRTFAPPVRDEESETQRKAHAKMVRSTRRSTQGITLEDLKSAEQYIKTTTTTSSSVSTTASNSTPATLTALTVSTSTVPTSTSTSSKVITAVESSNASLRVSTSSVTVSTSSAPPSSTMTSGMSTTKSSANSQDPSFSLESINPTSNTKSSDKTSLPLSNSNFSSNKQLEEKKEEKADDKTLNSTREGTQAVIQRRKKAKRRSTGVVHVDIDELDPDKKSEKVVEDGDGSGDEVEICPSDKEILHSKSTGQHLKGIHNGEIDYKKLYEEQLVENGKLLDRIRMHEKDLKIAKDNLEAQNRIVNATAESERREKRSLERKLSEMEEEIKEIEQLRLENERLKDENGALIRVISKLSR